MSRPRKLDRDRIDDLFAPTEPQRRFTPYDAKYVRWTVRVSEMDRAKMKTIAENEGLKLFDLVRWVLRNFVHAYEQGEIELPVEQYVVTVSRLAD